jgi:MYXO-CTERM domain-containing protein
MRSFGPLLLALSCLSPVAHAVTGADDDYDGVTTPDDCDDTDPSVAPGFPELCDGVDNDCDGLVDDADDDVILTAWYLDNDVDGFGDPFFPPEYACEAPDTFWVDNDDDCDDLEQLVNPLAPETCEPPGRDDDCDGYVDEADDDLQPPVWYGDADGDGFGDADDFVEACEAPPGHVANPLDCAPDRPEAYPYATELCGNGLDDDCDTQIDEGCESADTGSLVGTADTGPGGPTADTASPTGPTSPTPTDEPTQTAGGVPAALVEGGQPGKGCGCASAPGAPGSGGLALGMAFLGIRRRRRTSR